MNSNEPLAFRMRPKTLDEYVGQEYVLGKDKILYRTIKADRLSSIILFGPPGCGKTSLAKVISETTKYKFYKLNAVTAGVQDIKTLTQIQGIGAKSAQRIILELKDKIKKEQQIQELTKASKGISGTKTKLEQRLEHEQNVDEAIAALQVLGFNKKEIEKAFDKLVTEEMSTEEIIRKGLSILGK